MLAYKQLDVYWFGIFAALWQQNFLSGTHAQKTVDNPESETIIITTEQRDE